MAVCVPITRNFYLHGCAINLLHVDALRLRSRELQILSQIANFIRGNATILRWKYKQFAGSNLSSGRAWPTDKLVATVRQQQRQRPQPTVSQCHYSTINMRAGNCRQSVKFIHDGRVCACMCVVTRIHVDMHVYLKCNVSATSWITQQHGFRRSCNFQQLKMQW